MEYAGSARFTKAGRNAGNRGRHALNECADGMRCVGCRERAAHDPGGFDAVRAQAFPLSAMAGLPRSARPPGRFSRGSNAVWRSPGSVGTIATFL